MIDETTFRDRLASAMAELREAWFELSKARVTIDRLNKRCQVYEAGLAEKLGSGEAGFGRALANAAAEKYRAEAVAESVRAFGLQKELRESREELAKAVLAERKACAEVCYQIEEKWHKKHPSDSEEGTRYGADLCASAILARGEVERKEDTSV